MLWALDHLAVMGPDGISAACERMAVALDMACRRASSEGGGGGEQPTHGSLARIYELIKKATSMVAIVGVWYTAGSELMPIVDEVRKSITGG